jgi:hypothetical protein
LNHCIIQLVQVHFISVHIVVAHRFPASL